MIEPPQARQRARNGVSAQFLFIQKTQIQADIVQLYRHQVAGSTFFEKGFEFFQVKQIGFDRFVGIAPFNCQIVYESID